MNEIISFLGQFSTEHHNGK